MEYSFLLKTLQERRKSTGKNKVAHFHGQPCSGRYPPCGVLKT